VSAKTLPSCKICLVFLIDFCYSLVELTDLRKKQPAKEELQKPKPF
jgi:hypothetical protein